MVQRDLEVQEEQEVPLGNQVQRALQVVMALLALLVKEVLKDLKVQLDSLDQKALLDHLEKMACQDILGNVERLDFKARPALLGQGVLLDHRDQLVRLVQ